MAAGKLEIDITARLDKLDKGLAQAEHMVKKTGGTIDSAMNTPTAKVALGMGKVLGAMSALELGIKGFSAGMKLTEALTAEFAGSAMQADDAFAEMGEIVKQLPAGLGPVAQAVEQLVMLISGEGAEIEANLKTAAAGALREQIINAGDAQVKTNRQLQRQIEILKEEDPKRKRRLQMIADETQIMQDAAAAQDKLTEQFGAQEESLGVLRSLTVEEFILRQKILKIQVQQADEEERKAKAAEEAAEAERRMAAIVSEAEESQQLIDEAARATGTAQTAMGSFTFGRSDSPVLQEEIQMAKESTEVLRQILLQIQTAMRTMGFN
jgi:hypothetical protein